ncbi:hypothetical protein [Chengkuizengella axinellae]|uniref:Uncharacterized protein n=1 Tax=Chengkuizengella axinellae TaxID=3064388 RepID=A0ABT9IV36_9BACL|nr:hypothetical protein [Chengkuizengella sp. 2205SS18-9]MDP5273211.1 hypothetical protein [Chengkuizengella sp. 2205SS18-9]
MRDYKAEFEQEVNELIARDIVDRNERMKAVEAITDAYIDSIGEPPDSVQLERLADYILKEELTDPDPDKITNTEYPFMSEWQMETREKREIPNKGIEYEASADGRDYGIPKRRKRTEYENRFVDKKAIASNKERQERYRRDSRNGPVVSYVV